MKYYLKNPRHLYVLETDVISLGKTKHKDITPPHKYKNAESHIPLIKGNHDPYHAVIEKHHVQNYYVLTDLNTTYGTYVNNYKIQNRSVRLVPGDVIRFGSGGNAFEFGIISDLELGSVAGSKKGTPIETGRIEDLPRQRRMTPRINSASSSSSTKSIPRPEEVNGPQCHATGIQTPLLTLLPKRRAKSVPIRLKTPRKKTNNDPVVQSDLGPKQPGNHFRRLNYDCSSDCTERKEFANRILLGRKQTPNSEPWYFPLLRDKDLELSHMGDYLCQLSPAESENKRKDELIDQLTRQLAELEEYLEELKTKSETELLKQQVIQMTEEIKKLEKYEEDSHWKDHVIIELREEISKLESEKQILLHDVRIITQQNRIENITLTVNKSSSNSINQTRHILPEVLPISYSLTDISGINDNVDIPLNDKEMKPPQEIISNLAEELGAKNKKLSETKKELEQTKKDCILTKSFVENLEVKANNGQKRIKDMNTALEEVKKQTREANENSKTLTSRFLNLKEGIKHWRVMETINNELEQEQSSLHSMQEQILENRESFEKQSKDFEDAIKLGRKQSRTERLSSLKMKTLEEEIKKLKSSDLHARVKFKQDHSRLEKFRTKIIQTLFSDSGLYKPDFVIDDDVLVQMVQKAAEDRKDFLQLIRDTMTSNPSMNTGLEHHFDDETSSNDTSSTVSGTERRQSKSKRGKKL